MYKLVAIDLDGTLLNSYGVVTEYTKQVLRKISQKNVEIVLASGRPIDSIKTIANEIGGQNYFIAGNGALIYDLKKDEIIYEKYMSKEKVLEIIKICEENSISYNVYTEKTIRKLKTIDNIDILDVSHMSRKTIRDGSEEFQIEYYYTEISSKNVDKWDAILYLIKKLNIEPKEVVAVGDNINDKKMIINSGLGIAMFGSTKQVTDYSDYITQSNNEDGVAKALEKFEI